MVLNKDEALCFLIMLHTDLWVMSKRRPGDWNCFWFTLLRFRQEESVKVVWATHKDAIRAVSGT